MRIIMKSENMMAFAGLWNEWRDAKGIPFRSYTILTTLANTSLKDLHDRMPVILRSELIDSWLDPTVVLKEMKHVFDPYPDEELIYYPVSKLVNRAKNDRPECLKRVET